jgi:hypothetical protein
MAFEYYSEYEHSYRMGMLLEGPQDEHDLAELWRSTMFNYSSLFQNYFTQANKFIYGFDFETKL